MNKHPNDMTWQELRKLVSDMSFAALDLSQHLHFTNEFLKDEYKAAAYKKAVDMANRICNMPYEDIKYGGTGVVMFGKEGLVHL